MNTLDVRTLSAQQLKDMRKSLKRSSTAWFFFKRFTATVDGVSLDNISSELKRRKVQKLKLGRLNLGK